MQDVPIAVSAFTGAQIEEAGVKDIHDIAGQTPGLQIQSKGETEVFVFIRGIGSVAPGIGADPAVGIYIDGLYAARGTNAAAAFFDVERVEVDKGPQGALYGRNASSGAISIITRKPEFGESYGSALVGFGDEGQQKYEFIYNASRSDSTALRFGVKHDSRDGLYKNSLTGKDLNAREHTNARLSFLHDADGAFTSHFSAEYFDMSNTAAWVGSADSFADSVALNDPPTDQALESWRVNWTNEWDLSDAQSLTSITGYYTHDVLVTPVDADLLDIFIIDFQGPQTADYFSQELRLNGSSDAFENIGDIDVSGAEAEFRFLVSDAFELYGSLSVLDTEITSSVDPALVGNDTPTAAETSGSLGARFTTPMGAGEFTASAVWTFTDSFYWNIENTLEEPSFNTIYARAAWENNRWSVALVGEHLTDEKYLANSFIFLDTTNIRAWGRLLRIEVNLNF